MNAFCIPLYFGYIAVKEDSSGTDITLDQLGSATSRTESPDRAFSPHLLELCKTTGRA